MGTTEIEWTAKSWNPVIGCSIVSEGCRNCYAAEVAATRLRNHPDYRGLAEFNRQDVAQFTGQVKFLPRKLFDPLRARKPSDWFVNSMSDLFHPTVRHSERAAILGVVAACRDSVFKVLTKRPVIARTFFRHLKDEATRGHVSPSTILVDYALKYFTRAVGDLTPRIVNALSDKLHAAKKDPPPFPLSNLWFGVSAEDQKTFDSRVEVMLEGVPAAVRWVSVEPMLGQIKAGEFLKEVEADEYPTGDGFLDDFQVVKNRAAVDWIVCGGESGPGARPFDVHHARALKEECAEAGVPFFLKQVGKIPRTWVDESGRFDAESEFNTADGLYYYRLADEKGGDPAEWPEDMRVREYPNV